MTGVLRLKAQIGLIVCGTSFVVYMFNHEFIVNGVTIQAWKHLEFNELTVIDDPDVVITLPAHVAFFVSDPIPRVGLPPERARQEQTVALTQPPTPGD
jgi:hypothetical protein